MSKSTSYDQHAELRKVDRTHRRVLVEELPKSARALHVSVLRTTLAEGVPVNPAALAVVLSAHDERAAVPLCFTGPHVTELLWFAIAEFCGEYRLEMPEGCREALHAALAIGHAQGHLHATSDELECLFQAFHELAA